MTITLKFYSLLRQRFQKSEMLLHVEGHPSIREIFLGLPELHKSRVLGEKLLGAIRCALNCEYVEPDTCVEDGDEVAFIPPVSGG